MKCRKCFSFNPCFNGSCTLTADLLVGTATSKECFNPCFNGSCTLTGNELSEEDIYDFVSILVLMDHAL